MTRLLGIGTSSPALSLALFNGRACIAHDHRLIGRGHAEALVPAIAALPGQGQADAIIVDIGPGSFTGIRVGIAAARALGLAWGVPVHGVSATSLAAAEAFAAHPDIPTVTVLLDAGRGQILSQRIMADFSAAPFEILSPADIADDDAVFAGAGALLLPARDRIILHISQPDLAVLWQVPESCRSLAPCALYARPPDATLPV